MKYRYRNICFTDDLGYAMFVVVTPMSLILSPHSH